MRGHESCPFDPRQPEIGSGMFITMLAGDAPSSIAGAYTAIGLMDEPTGMVISTARLKVFIAVGRVRLPTMALISPVW